MYNAEIWERGPLKAAIGWVRLVRTDEGNYKVEKMSYEDRDIDADPDVVIYATSSPCGIEMVHDTSGSWTVKVGGQFHSLHKDNYSGIDTQSAWRKAKQTIIEMTVLDWLALID
jgi:hypothetical protein